MKTFVFALFLISNNTYAGIFDELSEAASSFYESITGNVTVDEEKAHSADEISDDDRGEVIDHRTPVSGNIPVTAREIEKARAQGEFHHALDEMGSAFNCGNSKDIYSDELSLFNTPMTPESAKCIAKNSGSPVATEKLLSNFNNVNEWSYLTVVATEYIRQLDDATRNIFGRHFNWDELTKINPYCDQFADSVKEARSFVDTTTPTMIDLFKPENIENDYLDNMFKQLNSRPISALVADDQLKSTPLSHTLIELLELQKEFSKKLIAYAGAEEASCSIKDGAGTSCDKALLDQKIKRAQGELLKIEKAIRTKESQYPLISQNYANAKSLTDIGGLMDFYDPAQGRDNIYALKKTYDEAIELGLSKRQLHMKMKGAMAPIIAQKKQEYKNLLAGICSTNIPASQTGGRGFSWNALTSATGILNDVAGSYEGFNGFNECLRNAAGKRESLYGTAAMAGAGFCAGAAIGASIGTLGAGALVVSPVCGAAFFGLDVVPKLESSASLASSISCQQILGSDTCSDEDRERIEDMDWWSTFGVTATVGGEALGVGIDAYKFGARGARVLRGLSNAEPEVAQNTIRLSSFRELWLQETLMDELGENALRSATDFMDAMGDSNPRFFYPTTPDAERIAIVEEYLRNIGGDPSKAKELLGSIDSVLKAKGEGLNEIADTVARGQADLALFKDNSNFAHELSQTRYFDLVGEDAKLEFLSKEYRHLNESGVRAVFKDIEKFTGNAQDPVGLLQSLRTVEGASLDSLVRKIDLESINTDAISRARDRGFQGTNDQIRNAIFSERISAIWSLRDGNLLSDTAKLKIEQAFILPEIGEDVAAVFQKSCQ